MEAAARRMDGERLTVEAELRPMSDGRAPAIPADASLFDTLRLLSETGREIVLVCDHAGVLLGTVTDGDIRRALLAGRELHATTAEQVMNRSFTAVGPGAGRAEVLDMMRARGIGQVPVVDDRGRLIGLHTVHELIGAVKRPNAAVIMAGGRGTRLLPLTHSLPKPMVRVAGRPMLERLVLHLVGYGIRTIYLSINYLGHIVEEYFADGRNFGCDIHYIRETEPRGTAGCLSALKEDIRHPLIVMNGDLVTQADIGSFLEFHARGRYCASMGVRAHVVPIPFGVAEVVDGALLSIREKPEERYLVNAGIYVLSPEALALIPPAGEYPMTGLFRSCIERRLSVGAFLVEEDWMDVGLPEQLLRANGHV